MFDDLRTYLTEALAPLLPADWNLIGFQRTPKTIDRITVVLKFTAFEPMPQAPIGSLVNEVVLTVISPLTDAEKAEAELDDAVRALCMSVDGLERGGWTEAKKVAATDTYLGWDITLSIRTDKE